MTRTFVCSQERGGCHLRKPLVLNPWNIDALEEYQNDTGQKVYNVLQTRLSSGNTVNCVKRFKKDQKIKYMILIFTYITSRGKIWYISHGKVC